MTASDQPLVAVTISEIRQAPLDDTGRRHCIVLLTELDGDRHLPIWVGDLEAAALAFKLEDTQLPRPLAHELLVAAVDLLGGTVREVRIRELVEGTYYATLVLSTADGGAIELDARPSDALNVALLTGADTFAAAHLLDGQEQQWIAEALDAEPVTAREIFHKIRPHHQEPPD